MTTKVPFKCQCGKVTGTVKNASPSKGNHVVCMCIDCQTYAHYLSSEAILDKNGGTELFQSTPNNFEIIDGTEFIKLLKLSPKGADRFYTGCCHTPIANNISAKMAFSSTPTAIMDFDAVQSSKAQTIGEVSHYCMAKYGYGDLPKNAHSKFPLLLTIKIFVTLLLGKLTKSYRPHPFYNDKTGEPIAPSQVIDKERKHEIIEKLYKIKQTYSSDS
ncbi:MAG: hypothetical protein HWE10_02280 [Gammaproteobacteria bacterium]|nr:hypothetical protein [Gammaproteobacteria bacterium]